MCHPCLLLANMRLTNRKYKLSKYELLPLFFSLLLLLHKGHLSNQPLKSIAEPKKPLEVPPKKNNVPS